MGTIIVQEPGQPATRRPASSSPTLEAMQRMVGGYIELYAEGRTPAGELVQVFVDEDGLCKRRPVENPEALLLITTLLHKRFRQMPVGNVVVLVGRDVLLS